MLPSATHRMYGQRLVTQLEPLTTGFLAKITGQPEQLRTLRALSAYQVYELTQLKTNRVYKRYPKAERSQPPLTPFHSLDIASPRMFDP